MIYLLLINIFFVLVSLRVIDYNYHKKDINQCIWWTGILTLHSTGILMFIMFKLIFQKFKL